MSSPTIRYVNAHEIDDVFALDWGAANAGDRFQELAIVGSKVIGVWSYTPKNRRGRVVIDSAYTDVRAKFRRGGVARQLWINGITRWDADIVEAEVATWKGLEFLARMMALLAFVRPELVLDVDTGNDFAGSWERLRREAALAELRRRGAGNIPPRATFVVDGKPLKLIKAATT